MEPVSSTVEVDGLRMHYWDWPSAGPALVCLHPSGNYGRIWEWVAEQLTPAFRIIAPDQRGHGDTPRPASGNGAEDYAADLAGLLRGLGLEQVIVAGHSLGARAGMVFAAQHPDMVTGLILVGGPHYATLHPGADVEYWQNNSSRTRARQREYRSAAEVHQALKAQYPHYSEAMIEHAIRWNTTALADGGRRWKYEPDWVADGLLRALDDLRAYALGVKCPTLILRAERSWELTPERMAEVQRLLPTSRTATIPNATANLELEAPEAAAREIRSFAAALVGLAAPA